MGPPAASYVPTVSSRNGEHSIGLNFTVRSVQTESRSPRICIDTQRSYGLLIIAVQRQAAS